MLVGLMGVGKTTVGRLCAERLGRPFVDTDDVVEALAGLAVPEIFATGGELRFRELERQAVADVCNGPEPLVIACGGGAVLDAENRRRLGDAGYVVWLRAPAAVLQGRVGGGEGRPLLSGDPLTTLERLATLRDDAYRAAGHASIDTDRLTPEEVAAEVFARYEEAER